MFADRHKSPLSVIFPELDQQNDSQSQSLADSADSARKADMNILTASAEEGALTTPEIVQKAQDSVVEIVTELVADLR